METIKSYGVGAVVLAGWVAVATFTVMELGRMPSMPVVRGPEVVIEVGTRMAQAETPDLALPDVGSERE